MVVISSGLRQRQRGLVTNLSSGAGGGGVTHLTQYGCRPTDSVVDGAGLDSWHG
jgi:hypothetical protein